jgi:DNA-binding CsgD family transcriptional regulator
MDKLFGAWLGRLGLLRKSGQRYYELDEHLYKQVLALAKQEQRQPEEVQADLLKQALEQNQDRDEYLKCWDELSRRERDACALTCLGYTNREIAARLGIAPDTVKSYLRLALPKFHVHSKNELKILLRDWNFSDWGPPAQM